MTANGGGGRREWEVKDTKIPGQILPFDEAGMLNSHLEQICRASDRKLSVATRSIAHNAIPFVPGDSMNFCTRRLKAATVLPPEL